MPLHQSQALKLALQKNPFFFSNIFGILPQSFEIFPQSDYKGDE